MEFESVVIKYLSPACSKIYGVVIKDEHAFLRVGEIIRDTRVLESTVTYAGVRTFYNDLPKCLRFPMNSVLHLCKFIYSCVDCCKGTNNSTSIQDASKLSIDINMADGEHLSMSCGGELDSRRGMDSFRDDYVFQKSIIDLVDYIENNICYCSSCGKVINELDALIPSMKNTNLNSIPDGLDEDMMAIIECSD